MIAGQDEMLERVFVCLLAGGHLLIEGVPGLARRCALDALVRPHSLTRNAKPQALLAVLATAFVVAAIWAAIWAATARAVERIELVGPPAAVAAREPGGPGDRSGFPAVSSRRGPAAASIRRRLRQPARG